MASLQGHLSDVNAKAVNGFTALQMASQNGHRDVVQALVDAQTELATAQEAADALRQAETERRARGGGASCARRGGGSRAMANEVWQRLSRQFR